MQRLMVFNSVTLDGYFTGAGGDMSWAHQGGEDAEWNAFVAGNAKGEGVLLFGRVTYDMMAWYWPSADAARDNPAVAEQMNKYEKVVFSRTVDKASWANTTLIKGDLATEVRRMKQDGNKDMVILGSGSIVTQLAQAGLVDEFQLVMNPVVLGQGRTLFESIEKNLDLKLIKTWAFKNGKVLLCYEPA